jgi:hypothetical protein
VFDNRAALSLELGGFGEHVAGGGCTGLYKLLHSLDLECLKATGFKLKAAGFKLNATGFS